MRQKAYPPGKLRIMTKKNGYIQYFHYDEKKKNKYPNGKYIKQSDFNRAVALAQKDYDKDCLENITKRIEVIKNSMNAYENTDEKLLLNSYHPAKRILVKQLELTDEEYTRMWLENTPGSQNNYPIRIENETNNGEIVRSKSEKIIADYLHSKGIPYVYEPRLQFGNGQICYPDFKVLNVRLRREFVWEHFGMMGDSNYSTEMCNKYNRYVLNNYWPGVNLLFTLETSETGINISQIKSIVQKYLL